jgi:hypothetical protein
LTDAKVANTRPRVSTLTMGMPKTGAVRATEAARALATEAAARRHDSHTRTPVRNPMSGPNATST